MCCWAWRGYRGLGEVEVTLGRPRQAFHPEGGQWIDRWEGSFGVVEQAGGSGHAPVSHVCPLPAVLTKVFQGASEQCWALNVVCSSRWVVSPAQHGCWGLQDKLSLSWYCSLSWVFCHSLSLGLQPPHAPEMVGEATV